MTITADISTGTLIVLQANRWRCDLHTIALEANLFPFAVGFNTALWKYFLTLTKNACEIFVAITID